MSALFHAKPHILDSYIHHNNQTMQVNKAVIAVPAKFSALQRQATAQAYKNAGLKVINPHTQHFTVMNPVAPRVCSQTRRAEHSVCTNLMIWCLSCIAFSQRILNAYR